MKKMYGVTVAMITPFKADNSIDVEYLESYTEYLIDSGVHCLYPCGTTGEMLKMSVDERKLVAETVVRKTNERIPVFIHVGSMTTSDSITLAQHAHEIHADGIGIVTPQFFGVNEREMEEYFVSIANSLPETFPVYLYNIPQCAANDLKPAVIDRIVGRAKNIIGVKYSFADMIRVKDYLLCNHGDFDVVFGPDRLFLPALSMGCVGTVSGCASCDPAPFVKVYEAFMLGDIEAARLAQKQATELCETVKNGSNMAIFKAALEFNGVGSTKMRAPALDLLESEKESVIIALREYKNQYN